MKFNYQKFLSTNVIFFAEFSSATNFKNIVWLRSYFSDVLVVNLIYTFVLSVFEVKNKMLLNIGIFIFACAIEFAQYFHFAELLGFQNNKIAMIALGNSFSWVDILCYAIGSFCIFTFNKFLKWDLLFYSYFSPFSDSHKLKPTNFQKYRVRFLFPLIYLSLKFKDW